MPPNSQAALQNYQSFANSMQSPDQLLQGQQQQLGISQAQQQVSGLRQAITNTTNLLNNVPSSVMGRTQNSLVTSAQANRQIQNEQAPISQTLGKENTDLSNQESDLNTKMSQATDLANLQQQGQANKLQSLKDIYDALYKGEQDTANRSDQQAQQQEAIREFNAQQSLAQQNSRTNNAKASQPSAAEIKQTDMAGAAQYLNSLKGGDGHVSQQTWNNAYQSWINAGYNGGDFVKQFIPFINQRYSGYHGFR